MSELRVTVILNQPTIDRAAGSLLAAGLATKPTTYPSEWVHEHDYIDDKNGIHLLWDDHRSYIPWTSVLRVDRTPCHCHNCHQEGTP